MRSLRQILGAALFDMLPALANMQKPEGWVNVVNRIDDVEYSSNPRGIRCKSSSTSSLHVCDVFPSMGRRLLCSVMKNWRFSFASTVDFSDAPEFSFIIPHRGLERQSLLDVTIHSIAALKGKVECIVVEQDELSQLRMLPGNTRLLHAPHAEKSDRWHKCFAFNQGAQVARGRILICHDGDIVVPSNYLEIIRYHLIQRELEVVFPQRFLFYLREATTHQIVDGRNFGALVGAIPEMIKQNWTGGTLAISKEANWKVGGFDESFTGWSGEDREFFDRCEMLNGWFYGYVPFLHLWHPPQPGRVSIAMRQQALEFTQSRLAIDRAERVEQLRALQGMPG